jgi:hypothetical protein
VRTVVITIVVVLIVLAAIGGAFILGVQKGQSSQTQTSSGAPTTSGARTTSSIQTTTTGGQTQLANMQTWQSHGMSVQVPAGLKTYYRSLQSLTNSDSGEVSWPWNNNQTSITLLWYTVPAYNITRGFQGEYSMLAASVTSISLQDQGNTTMSAHSWAYRTYTVVDAGRTYYVTVAIAYYASVGRAYIITYEDTTPNTLASMATYGNTFHG